MGALGDGATLFVDMCKRPIRMLTITDTMASHTCFARPFLSVYQHVPMQRRKSSSSILRGFGQSLNRECAADESCGADARYLSGDTGQEAMQRCQIFGESDLRSSLLLFSNRNKQAPISRRLVRIVDSTAAVCRKRGQALHQSAPARPYARKAYQGPRTQIMKLMLYMTEE